MTKHWKQEFTEIMDNYLRLFIQAYKDYSAGIVDINALNETNKEQDRIIFGFIERRIEEEKKKSFEEGRKNMYEEINKIKTEV